MEEKYDLQPEALRQGYGKEGGEEDSEMEPEEETAEEGMEEEGAD
jgi:hypothetical protein